GWPSHGNRVDGAEAGPAAQAAFMRAFLARAAERKLDYYVMEAFDQPWKAQHEGRTGAYWGLFTADRELKFPLTGAIVADPDWRLKAIASLLLAAPFMLWFALAFRRLRFTGRLAFCAMIQASAALIVWLVTMPFEFYLGAFDWLALGFVVPAILATIAVLLANGFEFTEVLWRRGWQRAFGPREAAPGAQPFVSIHLPCCNEPPEMVILTLESLARLDYEHFEVLVIDNNTRSESLWRPVQAWCERAGARFRFFHLDRWPGFKAGALNFALRETDARAEVIGVVDADYVVDTGWLRTLTGHFDDAQVAVVQAPQAHRGYENSFFQRMCNWEFDGFFRVGMHHRNERNAIIQHGTMTLVRRAALAGHDGWAEWCICEDAELGLRLMHAGLETRYVDAVLGQGLAPADFKAFKAQRFRWAFGAMQILKRRWHWLTGRGALTAGQRYHFLTGWFSWFADALHLAFVFASIAWTIGMVAAPNLFSLPLTLFLLPVLGFFAVKSVFGPILYRARVQCSWLDVIGASLASMGLSHAIARGVFEGLSRSEGTFKSTAKTARHTSRLGALAAAREELLMLATLVAAALAVVWRFGPDHREGLMWAGLLLAQALPYMAAVACAWISHRSATRVQRGAVREAPLPAMLLPRPAPAYARAA
ncbi:MAG: glycosyltransferase, partial [Burkholderiales bacterium]